MKRIHISDLTALRVACRIMPTLVGLDRAGIDFSLRMRWHPLEILAMQHGLDLIDRALVRALRGAR